MKPFSQVRTPLALAGLLLDDSRYGFLALFCYSMAMYQTLFISRARLRIAVRSLPE